MCRVEKADLPANASWEEKNNAHKKMMAEFKKKVASANILNDIRRREYYESVGVERRRKKKEAENQKLREAMKAETEKRKKKVEYEKN